MRNTVIVWIISILAIGFCIYGLATGMFPKQRTFKVIAIIIMYILWAIRTAKRNRQQ